MSLLSLLVTQFSDQSTSG